MPRPTLGGGRLEQGWCSEAPPQLSPGFLVRHRTTVYGPRDPGLADPRQPLYPRKGTLFLVYFPVLRIRIMVMRIGIRLLLFTLMRIRIWILPFNLMRVRIRILPLIRCHAR
jgi:hypothetical protein